MVDCSLHSQRPRELGTAVFVGLVTGLSNGLVESANTKTRLIIRRGFGFHSAEAFIALAMLTLGGPKPVLPGRQLDSG